MVYIITGDINSGKTSRILEIYKNNIKNSDGFISRKIYSSKEFLGYEIVRLSTEERKPLLMLLGKYKGEFNASFKYGQFVFSEEGLSFGIKIISNILNDSLIMNIHIDEIGPIELEDKGFCEVFKEALKSGKNIYVCIRRGCLKEVLMKFEISNYKII